MNGWSGIHFIRHEAEADLMRVLPVWNSLYRKFVQRKGLELDNWPPMKTFKREIAMDTRPNTRWKPFVGFNASSNILEDRKLGYESSEIGLWRTAAPYLVWQNDKRTSATMPPSFLRAAFRLRLVDVLRSEIPNVTIGRVPCVVSWLTLGKCGALDKAATSAFLSHETWSLSRFLDAVGQELVAQRNELIVLRSMKDGRKLMNKYPILTRWEKGLTS